MKEFQYLVQVILLIFCIHSSWIHSIHANKILASSPPIITSVSPAHGGTEGGSKITIYGYNFAQKGIFSQYNVFIGGEPCNVIYYYSNDGQIVCLTPKCTLSFCQHDSNWQGYQAVSLDVYVQTVESILGTSTTFTYNGALTPEVLRMSSYSWGTATSFIAGKITAAYLDDVSIYIGGGGNMGSSNAAFIGEADDINSELWGNSGYRWYYQDYKIFYRPPVDMSSGVYNLSLVVQDVESVGWGSGIARTFPDQYPIEYTSSYGDYQHHNMYTSALSGASYSLCLFPQISKVFPAVGSIAGGTDLTIVGSGFSVNSSNNIVYVGGQRCLVIASDFNTIKCISTAVDDESIETFKAGLHYSKTNVEGTIQPIPSKYSAWKHNSTRSYGSSGWLVKLWDWNANNANKFPDSAVRLSFSLHQALSFGLYYDVGSDWASQLGYKSMASWDSKVYVADYTTTLLAPYTGVYYFYIMTTDDYASLYGSNYTSAGKGKETLLVSATYSPPYVVLTKVVKSAGVHLSIGQRYNLRTRVVNTGGPDHIRLAVKVKPQFVNGTKYVVDGLDSGLIQLPEEVNPVPEKFSEQFLHHHSLKDIQIMSLSMDYLLEVQTIKIWGIKTGANFDSGSYAIIIQNDPDTSLCATLTLSSSASDIKYAMECAVNTYVSPARKECGSFSVSKKTQTTTLADGTQSTTLTLEVTFQKDNVFPYLPYSLLGVNLDALIGTSNLSSVVKYTQFHSTNPSGEFSLEYKDQNNEVTTVGVPYNADRKTMQDIFQINISPEINVNVELSQYYNSYTWTITFINPRGFVPQLRMNASSVIGDHVTSSVTKYQNGSTTSLWFDPIPAWMTEIPLREMNTSKDLSNVEVYVRGDTGDILKSVCDNTGDTGNNKLGMVKGHETSCSYDYKAEVTAVVSNFSLTEIDADYTQINIYGSNFQLAGSNKAYVVVSIASQNCNITTFYDDFIGCVVDSVTWGNHVPRVSIAGYGYALTTTDKVLFFAQSIYSITPEVGSMAGGQLVTIQGRGLRPNASIQFVGVPELCEIVHWKSTTVVCRTPASSSVFTSLPSSVPSSQPSISPSSTPTLQPFVTPSSSPSSLPRADPSGQPSAMPTNKKTTIPTTKPTLTAAPTHFPTWSPTVVPTTKPTLTGRPTQFPILTPTVAPTQLVSGQRRRLEDTNDNTYGIIVDGFNTTLRYTYDAHLTPQVLSFTPSVLSSGYSENVSFHLGNYGRDFLSENVTVMIGDQNCIDVNKTSFGQISCVLVRNASATTVSELPIRIYFEGEGYAGSTLLNVLPSVLRGFELFSSSPVNGSVLGGNVLNINGFGFDYRHPQRHVVQLSEVGLIPYTVYDRLLLSLGFSVYTNRTADQVLNCTILALNATQLQCHIPEHMSLYANNTYVVSLTLNNIVAAEEANLTYIQHMDFTPTLTNSVNIVSWTTKGEYVFTVQGTQLAAGKIDVKVGNVDCQVVNLVNQGDYQILTVSTPPLTAGTRLVSVNVATKGKALSTAVITVGLHIETAQFSTPGGSVAGGSIVEIRGYGFSSTCNENSISLSTISAGMFTFSEFESCVPYKLVLRTPTVLNYYFSHSLSEISATAMSISVLQTTASIAFGISPFSYSLAHTPRTHINRTTGYGGLRTKVLVTSYESDSGSGSNINITLAGKTCSQAVHLHSTNRIYDTEIDCSLPDLAASATKYDVVVDVQPFGYAISNTSSTYFLPQLTALLEANAVVPSVFNVSVYGGLNITVIGEGFSDPMLVTVCDEICPTVVSSFTSLTCTLPARLTRHAVDEVRLLGLSSDLISSVSGTLFSSPAPSILDLNIMDDSNYETYTYFNSKTCTIGIKVPVGYTVSPYRLRFYPRLRHASDFSTVIFEGSNDGGKTYTTFGSLSYIHEGWNFIDVDSAYSTHWFTSLRYRAADTSKMSYCALAEIDFLGITASVNESCPIVVHSVLTTTYIDVGTAHFASLETFTPVIRSLFPNNGSALGGTTVTLYGDNLVPIGSDGSIAVTFSGVECRVVSYDIVGIRCITGARTPDKVEISSISVLVSGRGYAAVDSSVEFLYIDKWSALTSWMYQEPPVDGDIVWIPDGQVILLDTNTPILTFLLVEGSLYFDRTKDLSVDSFYIFVLGGYMEVGTAEEPFEMKATITLHGDRYKTIEVPPIGSKVLAVADKGVPQSAVGSGIHQTGRYFGQLEVHGAKRLRTWTKVNVTAKAGNNWLITSEPVDFKYGESVILTGNEKPDCSVYANCYGYEELIVLETIDLHNVTFTQPLAYDHRSEIVEVEGRSIDMRCEIGLLSRNVIIQGSEDNSDGQLFGVHTVAMMSGVYRMENVELRRCGQSFNFGRYCTHSHKGEDMEGSYVKANSIHHSFQRAVTTHDTRNWEVRDNVAFDVKGHAFFVEDGTEEDNYITGNLGVFIKPSSSLLKGDQAPAIFWAATPRNFWRDNVAAHSSARGMWFEFAGMINPDPGEEDTCPTGHVLGEFRNNTFHSNSQMGLRIYPQWTPVVDQCDLSSAPSPQYLYNLVSYRNGGNGLFSKRHGSLHHRGYNLVENGGDEVSIVHYANVDYDTNPTFENCLFAGSLDPNFNENWGVGKCGIFSPQEEYFYVKNSTFLNYGASGVLTGCNECLVGSDMNQGGLTTRYEQLRFVKSKKRIFWSETKKEILWDLDGSLGGVADSMIVRSYPSVVWPDVCTVLPYEGYTDSVRCGGNGSDVRIRRMQLENVSPGQLYYTDLDVISEAGTGTFYFLPLDTSGWVFPVVTGANRTYALDWADSDHLTTRTMSLTLGRIAYLTETMNNPAINEDVVIRNDLGYTHTWDYDPYTFAVQYNSVTRWVPINHTNPMQVVGNARYVNYTFDVLVTNKGASLTASIPFGVSTAAKLCPPRGCPVPPVPNPGMPLLWSKKFSWSTNNYKVPTVGQAVTISADMWIVMDITPPNLGCITIEGKLTFLSNASHPRSLTLAVQCIKLWGTMEILGEDNSSFAGQATVIVYGAKGASPPVTMGEGNFVGSKVISVAGRLAARGKAVATKWTKLNTTATAGSSILNLSEEVSWSVGDEVVISPTGYFNEAGTLWSTKGKIGNSVESRVISAIHTIVSPSGNISQITLSSALNHTHLCETIHGEKFCGAVGHLTRTVKFISLDGDTLKTTSYGYGANIHVIDVVDSAPYRYGSVDLRDVEFNKFGKLNSDHYAVSIAHRDYSHPPSYVMGCAFKYGFNLATRISHANNVTFSDNIAIGNYGGGVYIEDSTTNFEVNHNLLLATYQLPSVLLSSYPWVRPIASFTILSPQGVCTGNLAAGSDDQGFSVATSMFKLDAVKSSQCFVTKSAAYSYSMNTLVKGRVFYDNEAVACRGGLFVVAVSPSESDSSDCVVVSGFTAWRNSHTGITSVDAQANILIAGVVLAENHIGITLHFYKEDVNVFSGIVASKIIGSIGLNTEQCIDLPDSVWNRGRHCQVFTSSDPLGVLQSCGSVISGLYRRVGVLIPQWTNKPKTCAIAGRFSGLACDPPTTPDRLCEMPWEKRYGLPLDVAYAEQHIHDTIFIGFQSYVFNKTSISTCIPSNSMEYSPAVAINPSQIDMQPTLITSHLEWEATNLISHLSFGVGTFTGAESGAPVTCADRPCSGQNMMIIHDLDGTLANQGASGQLVWNNPEYMAPDPFCYEIPEVYQGVYFCKHHSDPAKNFIQYNALWRDWGPQVIQPIFTTRHFEGEHINRSFASYGPIDDMCAKRMYFSRFPMLIANGTTHRIMSVGTTPSEFLLRWDAPTANHVAILEVFFTQSYDINVLVSDDPNNNFQIVKKFSDRYPNFADPAGSNTRDPQKRLVIMVVRGGSKVFYRFRQTPVVAVTMKLDLPFSTFVGDTFIANMALLLGITRNRIKISDVRQGSTVVDFSTAPNITAAANISDVANQMSDLNNITSILGIKIASGELESTLGAPVLTCAAVVPHSDLLDPYNNVQEYPANATLNSTSIRAAEIAATTPIPVFLASYPTSQPSQQPSSIPSNQPTFRPSQHPSRQPISVPSCSPSHQPNMVPSLQPYSKPTRKPTLQPAVYPSDQPSSSPVRNPTSQPVRKPSSQPSRQPNRRPSSQPSKQPFSKPSMKPSSQPKSVPTRQPAVKPTTQPSKQPLSKPSKQPIQCPTTQPSFLPTTQPSSRPSRQPSSMPSHPSSQPSSQPSGSPTHFPTSQPSKQPQSKPTSQPSKQPAMKPSSQPSQQPTLHPSRFPSSQPSKQPFHRPSSNPSRQPSVQPSRQPLCKPTSQPSTQPSMQPSCQPILDPTTQPTLTPSLQPVMKPSFQPSSQPSVTPTAQPSNQPSIQPIIHPSSQPSTQPFTHPSVQPSEQPSVDPTSQPTTIPSHQPLAKPSTQPTTQPSTQPIRNPTTIPSLQPSANPSIQPSISPSIQPSEQPNTFPSSAPSDQPTRQPSSHPSTQPTTDPSALPTLQPSASPTTVPSIFPSEQPSIQPTSSPSQFPSTVPSQQPSKQPSTKPSVIPSIQPIDRPTIQPTIDPTSQPSVAPSKSPTTQPSTYPSSQPFQTPTYQPSTKPTMKPSLQPSEQPSIRPTAKPSFSPSIQPTTKPSTHPTTVPSFQPTILPSNKPSSQPSTSPSMQPVSYPTSQPSLKPSSYPSQQPVMDPSIQPSILPTTQPNEVPSTLPTTQPTDFPSTQPHIVPSTHPSTRPSFTPSCKPSIQPSTQPSFQPSIQPSEIPSVSPSKQPISHPSVQPSEQPTIKPSAAPSRIPSSQPNTHPSTQPNSVPSSQPSSFPSTAPSRQPLRKPSLQPNDAPSTQPSTIPSVLPSTIPSSLPTLLPSQQPSTFPSSKPSIFPSTQPSNQPLNNPSVQPVMAPSHQPSMRPTNKPQSHPSSQPVHTPTTAPSNHPSEQPNLHPSIHPTHQPIDHPTSLPSMQPSSEPSLQDTFDPTSSPTHHPSQQPAHRPSSHPSIYPTDQPNAHPSCQPQSHPSMQPNSYPSLQPSDRPTSRPSGSKVTAVTLETTIVIGGTSASDLKASPTAQAALINAASVPVVGVTPTVTVKSITAANARRNARMLAATDSTQVVLTVQIKLTDSTAPATAYDSYTAGVKTNVDSGDFTKSLQSGDSAVFASSTVSSSSLQFSSYTVTTVDRVTKAPPTSHPTASPVPKKKTSSAARYDLGLLVGLVVGAVALLVFFLYLYYARRTANAPVDLHKVKIVKVQPVAHENFFDLERTKTPDSARRRRSNDAQPKGFNIKNIHYDEATEPAAAIPEITSFEAFGNEPAAFKKLSRDNSDGSRPELDQDEADPPTAPEPAMTEGDGN